MTFDWTSIVVAALTAGGTVGVGRAARRTRAQERRDDFTTVTARMDKEFARLDSRVTAQDQQLARQDETIRGQDRKILGQASAIGHLSAWVRALVMFTRSAGLEPPPPPPVPDDARPYLSDIGV